MKTFNLMLVTMTIAIGGASAVSSLSHLLMGDAGAIIALPVAFLLGFNARRIAEKVIGYTLTEALAEEKKDE